MKKYLKLAQKNKAAKPESFETLYGHQVTREIRKEYSQDRIEAIVNNYLDDPSNPAHAAEFKALQEYRRACKAKVKAELGM
jgi:hypothetical protein